MVLPSMLVSFCTLVYLRRKGLPLTVDTDAFAWTLVVLFCSDWLCRPYNFFQGPSIRGEIILASAAGYMLIRNGKLGFLNWLPVAAVGIVLCAFFFESRGRLLFGDDHSVFMYRLQLLKENLPDVPFYNPLWNAGFHDKFYFNTGALGVFLLGSPLLALFRTEQVYNFLAAAIMFILPPLCTFYAARLAKLKSPAPAIASVLSLCLGLIWHRWALKYGTLGFAMSAGLMPLCLVLVSKIIDAEQALTKTQACIFVAAATLMLLWPLSAAAFMPLAAWALFALPRILRKRYMPTVVLALFVINLPWISAFLGTCGVGDFMRMKVKSSYAVSPQEISRVQYQADTAKYFRHAPGRADFSRILPALRQQASSGNPLIVLFVIPGVLLLGRGMRRHFAVTLLWLLMLGSVMVPLKPQLELDRMMIFFMACACLPAAAAVGKILSDACTLGKTGLRLAAPALTAGFLLAGPLAAGAAVRNRSAEPYYFADPIVETMAQAIKQHAGSGRVLYSGCVVHDLSNGHLSPLAYFSGMPLMASSQLHDLWWYTPVFPPEYEGGGKGAVREYLDLYNVSAVFSHEEQWHRYFASRPDEYRLVWESKPFRLYQRFSFRGSYFLEGEGEVTEQKSGGITLVLRTPQAVIKFNYFPFLTASACNISGKKISGSVNLIELQDCPLGVPITIRALPPFRRIFEGK